MTGAGVIRLIKIILMKALYLLTFLAIIAASPASDTDADAIVGVWKNGSGKGHIQIYKHNQRYYGKIIWLRDGVDPNTGKPKVDRKNTDPDKRSKPLIGLVMMRDFRFDGKEWKDGRIYNPSDGKEYKGYMKLKDPKTLTVRGYVGVSFLGKSDTWTRVK